MAPVIRRPAVAGYYYPADPGALAAAIDAWTRAGAVAPPRAARALVLPHGGYRHAGAIAGAAVAMVGIPRRCIVVGPSHTGRWMPWSLMASGAYRTPLGDVPIDARCADTLRARCPFLEPDAWAQAGEHAIEVLVPFLQRRGPPDLTIVPVIMGSEDAEQRARLATALAQAVRMQEERVLLIASTDLSHYEPRARSAAKDRMILDRLLSLDGPGLLRVAREARALMCGDGAAACVLEAAAMLGARSARLAAYGTSADAGGDPDSVIGYAGVVIR